MIALLAVALAGEPIATGSMALQAALEAELARALTLHLPEAPAPYLVTFDVLDGTVRNSVAEDGALVQSSTDPHRNLRAEVRIGDYELDSSNFGSWYEPNGVIMRDLPVEDHPVALRREVWRATDAAYKNAVQSLAGKVAAREGSAAVRPPDFQRIPPMLVAPTAHPGSALSSAEVDAFARNLSGAASPPGVESAIVRVRDWQGWRLVVTSEGTRAWTPTGNIVVRVQAEVRRADGGVVQDARWWVGRDAADLPPLAELTAECEAMAASLLVRAAAPDPTPWLGPVLFEGEAAAELFSQLLAPEVVGTRAIEDGDKEGYPVPRSAGRVGRRLLPSGWNVWDDPSTRLGVAGEYAMDHEAVAPRRVDLVKDGVLRDLLMSRIPNEVRGASTGHGRSLGSDRRVAIPGFVRVVAPKLLTDRQLRRQALRLAAQTGQSRVLVVTRILPLAMVDQRERSGFGSGLRSGLTAPIEACLLDGAGVCEPVRNLRFVGVDRRMLLDIVGAAAGAGPIDMLDGPPGRERDRIGLTGGVPTTWDVPSVLLAELELDIAGGGEPRVLSIDRAKP